MSDQNEHNRREAMRHHNDEEQQRKAEKGGSFNVAGRNGGEFRRHLREEATETFGDVIGSVAKAGFEAIGEIVGSALDEV